MLKKFKSLSIFVFIICFWCLFANSVPPGYISTYNGYCDDTNTLDEKVECWWSSVGNQITLQQWTDSWIPNWRNVAQHVTTETCIDTYWDWPNYPFVDSTPVLWSDTWGVCVYFTSEGFHPNSNLGVDPITSRAEFDAWDNATIGGTDPDTWRVVGINGFGGIYAGSSGVTTVPTKISIVVKGYGNQTWLHEWGHTYDVRNTVGGHYMWPLINSAHYGNGIQQRNHFLNFMHHNVEGGNDGDINYKSNKFPWCEPYWTCAKRWCDNW